MRGRYVERDTQIERGRNIPGERDRNVPRERASKGEMERQQNV